MATQISAEKLRRRTEKEISKWEKQRKGSGGKLYFAYIVFIITLIYATDEIASQIGMLMKSEIAADLMSNFGQSSVGMLDLVSSLAIPFQAIGLLYRPLADRWGRKKFLIINTFGMSFSLLLIYLSNNIALYVIGACFIQFFIPHDMHVVYIMESSPSKHRARIYSTIKFFANMGVMLVPLLRRWLVSAAGDSYGWRMVYFIPAVIGLVVSFIALLGAKETPAFVESRLNYLRMSEEEKMQLKNSKKAESKQGGLIPALRFALSHKQLRWLYVVSALANIGFYGSINYEPILNYGYEGSGIISAGDAVTTALILFPIGSAVAQVLMGFVSDWLGRKAAAILTAFNCLVGFLGFSLGAKYGLNPYVIGFLSGVFVGSYYSVNDVLIMMIGESAPTNLRSSAISAQYIVTAVGYGISLGVGTLCAIKLGNSLIGTATLCMLVPGFVSALAVLFKNVGETKGIDMDTVTGAEWD
ncbi:MAG: MFS transporter [Clostridia bacterium]|nr:MFS transporter [Clostridia bacterium]